MTREEQIIKEASKYANVPSHRTEWTDGWEDYNDFDQVFDAFKNGAKWADEHPKKSIKDQLKAVLTANGRYAGSSTTSQLLRELADEWDD